eukprot:m.8578 g.8578  ORF g.8578 m.8578 type:complete len:899 (-) comp3926_c0_seq1:73-2769(-)
MASSRADEGKEIKAIDKSSVHRICSGQVVLSLAVAVKELIENSVDAGATTVEIKLRENGLERVEVTDNGSGVREAEFQALTLKHHTSKIRDFNDVSGVTTFGFRGEALSSLCALSDVKVTTCTKSAPCGSAIEYDKNGKISNITSCAHQVGTTVTLSKLFASWPVRLREFQKNAKREYARMIHLVQAYCLVRPDVRFSCTNVSAKGSKSNVISTPGGRDVETIVGVLFGQKQLQALVPFKPSKEWKDKEDAPIIRGFISKPEPSCSRSSSDRVFLSINKRPCDHSKVSKAINEIYHQFIRGRYPFVALDMELSRQDVDVNLTPDKRAVMIIKESNLIEFIKSSLTEMFQPYRGRFERANSFTQDTLNQFVIPGRSGSTCSNASSTTYPASMRSLSNVSQDSMSSLAAPGVSHSCKDVSPMDQRTESKGSPPAKVQILSENLSEETPMAVNSTLKLEAHTVSEQSSQDTAQPILMLNRKRSLNTEAIGNSVDNGPAVSQATTSTPENKFMRKETWCCLVLGCVKYRVDLNSEAALRSHYKAKHPRKKVPGATMKRARAVPVKEREDDMCFCSNPHSIDQENQHVDDSSMIVMYDDFDKVSPESTPLDAQKTAHTKQLTAAQELPSFPDKLIDTAKFTRPTSFTKAFDLAAIDQAAIDETMHSSSETEEVCKSFQADITDATAEEELVRTIHQEDFEKMEILGQFNLGFIIVRLKNDLFIVDQHATDEKYNFERLQLETKVRSQALVVPKPLELTALNEEILIDNIEIFRKNGFDFIINEAAPVTQRVKMSKIPISKGTLFGFSDVEEMLFLLADRPGVMCRPSRLRSMFAMRACRSSVMIGTALSKTKMREIVDHMGTMEQPWNCPHGRPTMRHIFNLQEWETIIQKHRQNDGVHTSKP